MTDQQIVNKVYNWFITKERPPAHIGADCVYYAEGGKKRCAVGCVVTAKEARFLEQNFGGGVIRANSDVSFRITKHLGETFSEKQLRLLADLQSAHDSGAMRGEVTFRRNLVERIRGICDNHDLKFPGAAK